MRPHAQCPDCPKEYQVINCFLNHLQYFHGYSNEKAKEIVIAEFAKVGVECVDCAKQHKKTVSPKVTQKE